MKVLSKILIQAVLFLAPVAGLSESVEFDGNNHSSIGLCITDLRSGETVLAKNQDLNLIPASILKCLTAATAMTMLPEDFRFSTRCYISGELTDSVLNGNLIVIGTGDPSIEHPGFKMSSGFVKSIVDAVQSKGIKQITGTVMVPDETLPDYGPIPQWAIEDAGWEYGSGLYAVNYAANSFRLNPGTGEPVTDVPVGPIDVTCYVTGTDETEIIHGANSSSYIISGNKLADSGYCVKTAMPSPTKTVARLIAEECKSRNISIYNNEAEIDPTPGELILTWYSPAIDDLAECMMHHSDNLIAEAVLRAIAPSSGRQAALDKQTDSWASRGIECDYVKISDGSGLSRTNSLTVRFVNDILSYMAKTENCDRYASLFPLSGKEGTVRNFLKGTRLEGKLALKTGSMGGIQCYAGYKLDKSGHPTHSIVIMINNFFCPRNEIKNAVKAMLLKQFP